MATMDYPIHAQNDTLNLYKKAMTIFYLRYCIQNFEICILKFWNLHLEFLGINRLQKNQTALCEQPKHMPNYSSRFGSMAIWPTYSEVSRSNFFLQFMTTKDPFVKTKNYRYDPRNMENQRPLYNFHSRRYYFD